MITARKLLRRVAIARMARNLLRQTEADLASGMVHDLDYWCFARMPLMSPVVLDIGANRGQSIASFLNVVPGAFIHAFEANPFFFPVLRRLSKKIPHLCVHEYGLGRATAKRNLYVPYCKNAPFLEEATLSREQFAKPWVAERMVQRGGYDLECVEVTIRAVDELGIRADIVKIDVEGAEHEVLLGMRDTIRRWRPILLIENNDWGNVTEQMRQEGYEPYRYKPEAGVLVPYYGQTPNAFYLHVSVVGQIPCVVHSFSAGSPRL